MRMGSLSSAFRQTSSQGGVVINNGPDAHHDGRYPIPQPMNLTARSLAGNPSRVAGFRSDSTVKAHSQFQKDERTVESDVGKYTSLI